MEFFTRDGAKVERAFEHGGKKVASVWHRCGRCGGQGRSEAWRFTGFVCYQCGGECGYSKTVRVFEAEELVKLNTRRDALRAKKAAKAEVAALEAATARAATRAAFHAAHADLIAKAESFASGNEFLADLLSRLDSFDWTEGQIAAVAKTCDQIAARNAERAASRHVGKIGERIEVAVTVANVYSFERPKFNAHWINEWCHIVTMRDEAGNAIVSKGSFFAEKGETFTIRATVKDHGSYRDEQQTTVNRVKVK